MPIYKIVDGVEIEMTEEEMQEFELAQQISSIPPEPQGNSE